MQTRARSGAGTNQEAVRRHNLGTLLGHVHLRGRVSRSDLTALMGLNRSTIAGLVAELESLGLAEQVRPSAARGGAGRPSPDVVPVQDGAHALAIDVRVDGLAVARVGLGGAILARATGPIPASRDPHAVADAILAMLRLVVRDVPAPSALVGVGMAVPGVVRRSDGLVRLAPNLGWVDVPFSAIMSDRLRGLAPVELGNDADLGALSEHLRGAGVDVADLVYLSGEVGVGAGVIVDGHRLVGAGGYAGEIGHLSLDPRGRECHCGNRGCWETQVGAHAIAEAIGCPPERVGSLDELLDAMTAADPGLREVGRNLGRGLANAVNLLNPQVVVLGGFLRSLYPLVAEEVDQALHEAALVAPRELVRIALPGLGADAVLVGAAETAFERLLADPVSCLGSARHDVEAALSVA